MSTLSRELTGRIVQDLARATRSVPEIARRYHVHEATVKALQNHYGPDVQQLIDAAAELRRPADTPAVDAPAPAPVVPVVPAPAPASKRGDGLTPAERVECRAWCGATSRDVGAAGMIPRSIVEAWDAAGRPVLAAETVAEPVVDMPRAGVADDIRLATDILEDLATLVPFAAEYASTELSIFLGTAHELAGMLRRSRHAQDLIARAQTALKRIGVDVSPASARQVLAELEVL